MQQYYAHPQNLFWPFIRTTLSMPETPAYQDRLALLNQHGVGLWDVLQECFRTGSLDSDIEEISIIANDFSTLLQQFPSIRHIFFNGSKAEQAFRRHVLKHQSLPAGLHYHRLPSTSPANASIPRARKLADWQYIATILHQTTPENYVQK